MTEVLKNMSTHIEETFKLFKTYLFTLPGYNET